VTKEGVIKSMIVNVKMGGSKTLFFHVCPLYFPTTLSAPSRSGGGSYIQLVRPELGCKL